MDIDDEEPPMLVEVKADAESHISEEPNPIKVPITIVTGKCMTKSASLYLLT